MVRTCWLPGIMMLLVGQAAAQVLQVDKGLIAPIPAEKDWDSSKEGQRSYVIELKLLEGEHFSRGMRARSH